MYQYEEYHSMRPPWQWVVILLLCAAVVGWGLFHYYTVADAPREWDFGGLPETPAESEVTSDVIHPQEFPPRQVLPLPEAVPKERIAK